MERNYGEEIDQLKQGLAEIRKMFQTLSPANESKLKQMAALVKERKTGEVGPDIGDIPQKKGMELMLKARERNLEGLVTYYGAYESEGFGYLWEKNESSIDELLAIDDDEVAKVLASFGNKQRLAILKTILKEPLTVNELVEKLDMRTTGQVYHHLKALQAADLIKQGDKGKFQFKAHRVHGLIMVLTGVNEVLDGTYSKGSWDTETAE